MAKANANDVWDLGPPESRRPESTFVTQTWNAKAAKPKVVRDDWDDDDEDEANDDEEQEGTMCVGSENKPHVNANALGSHTDGALGGRIETEAEEDSHTLWEEANKRAPMPELIVASASTSHGNFVPPPPAALQPALRILKRPSPKASAHIITGAASSGSLISSSLVPTSGSGSGGTSPAPRGTLAEREAQYEAARSRIFGDKGRPVTNLGSTVTIVRDPLGPASVLEGGQDKAYDPAKGFEERRRGKE